MKPELEEILIKIDPIFFQERVACINGDMNEMNSCMAFGCECGDGWFEPLKKMTIQISFLNRAGIRDNVEIICEQLKEKYGTLRVYYRVSPIDSCKEPINQGVYNNLVSDIVDNAEKECMSYCEICGKKEEKNNPIVETSGWISYICYDCALSIFLKECENKNREPQIGAFHNVFSFLSMTHKYRFLHINRCYNTVAECFYSVLKPEKSKFFTNTNNPYIVFDLAKEFITENEKHSIVAVELMRDVLKSKFNVKDGLGNLLKKTNDYPIIFGNTFHDNFWGYCYCNQCKDKEHQNIYGNFLMEIRKNL